MKIRNWSKFQHFKDRRPPWIKIHREILDQRDINLLSDCSFRVLVGLWLLASEDEEMDGNLPSIEDIAFRLRMTIPNINKALADLKPFLYQDDVNLLSDGCHDDDPETEAEKRQRQRREREEAMPLFTKNDLWKEWMSVRVKKKAVNSDKAIDSLVNKIILIEQSGKYTAEQAITTAVENSWKSVCLEWMDNQNQSTSNAGNGKSVVQEVADAFARHNQ